MSLTRSTYAEQILLVDEVYIISVLTPALRSSLRFRWVHILNSLELKAIGNGLSVPPP